MNVIHHSVELMAGVALFLYGLLITSENLQVLAADRIRAIMKMVSRNHLFGIIGGIALTVLLQSSGAVTVMMTNLASAGVVSLTQVMGVMIGSTIGTTVTVQLISFHVTEYYVYPLIVGFFIFFVSQGKKAKEFGLVVFSLGLVFFGLQMMGQSVALIKEEPAFKNIFVTMNENPILTVFITTFFSGMVHSSAVVVGMAMALAGNGVITLYDSLFWIYGANIGTTFTALMASWGGNYLGRQVAWAHFLYKMGSVAIFIFITATFASFIEMTDTLLSRQIANGHTLLNILSAILFFPFINIGAVVVQKLFPRPANETDFGPKYLDASDIASPMVAYSNAVRETIRMSEYALTMVKLSLRSFEKDDPHFLEDLKGVDKKVDLLNREIKYYLVKCRQAKMTAAQKSRIVGLITVVADIEAIGDVVDNEIMDLARKKNHFKLNFSKQGYEEVKEFHYAVVENFELAISAFTLQNLELARKVIDGKHKIRAFEEELKAKHIDRLEKALQDSINTSDIHLELLTCYKRINSLACNLVYPIIFKDRHTHAEKKPRAKKTTS